MFTGIIENIGTVIAVRTEGANIQFTIDALFANELKVDQSLAHNGCCLTVTEVNNGSYSVTAIKETLDKSNLGTWSVGSKINLERCTMLNGRLDGHIVQGHVDTKGECTGIENQDGSWKYTFQYTSDDVTVEKGSITMNGISLTVVDSRPKQFSVCVIPYTYENTNLKDLKIGEFVNLEFDIIGKYVAKLLRI